MTPTKAIATILADLCHPLNPVIAGELRAAADAIDWPRSLPVRNLDAAFNASHQIGMGDNPGGKHDRRLVEIVRHYSDDGKLVDQYAVAWMPDAEAAKVTEVERLRRELADAKHFHESEHKDRKAAEAQLADAQKRQAEAECKSEKATASLARVRENSWFLRNLIERQSITFNSMESSTFARLYEIFTELEQHTISGEPLLAELTRLRSQQGEWKAGPPPEGERRLCQTVFPQQVDDDPGTTVTTLAVVTTRGDDLFSDDGCIFEFARFAVAHWTGPMPPPFGETK